MELRKAKVVMLPTEDTNPPLHKGIDGRLRVNHTACPSPYEFPQHLYIVMNDVIKEGDYWIYICPINGLEGDNEEYIVKNNLPKEWFEKLHDKANYYKIIASTDPKIMNLSNNGRAGFKLPQIPQVFIKKYCEEGGFDEVDVEYNNYFTKGNYTNKCIQCGDVFHNTDKLGFICKECGLILKLLYNEIFIEPTKVNWTRAEVIEICTKAYDGGVISNIGEEAKDWIKENL